MEAKVYTQRFGSVRDLVKWMTETPRTQKGEKYKKYGSEDRDSDFSGTKNYKEAEDLLLYGDKDLARKIEKGMKSIQVRSSGKRSEIDIYKSVQGFAPNVGAYLAGDPRNMLNCRQVIKSSSKVINLYYNCSVRCDVTTDQIITTASKVLCVISNLEAKGYRVNLFVSEVSRYLNNTIYTSIIKVKDSGKKLDILRIAFPMAHPSFLRRILFNFIERFVKNKDMYEGYGKSIESTDEIRNYLNLGKNDIVLSYYNCKDKSNEEIIKEIETQVK